MKEIHEVIVKCQQIIVDRMKDKSPEASILLAKSRVDEGNLPQIEKLAKDILPPDDREIVIQAVEFLKRALSEICDTYCQWALNIGRLNAVKYNVSPIDSNSLALEGLYKAAIRFNPVGSFKSYAASWIRQCIQRYADSTLVYTLDQPLKEGERTTFIDNLSADDVIGCNSFYYSSDPFSLEELRAQYCPHLSYEEVKDIVQGHLIYD